MSTKSVKAALAVGAFGVSSFIVLGGQAQATYPGDNGRIACASQQQAIWSMNPDGTVQTQLTPGSNADLSPEDEEPRYSPDGTKIVFTSARSGAQEIWVMNVDGSAPTRLTTAAGAGMFSEDPSWSLDGSKIIFTSDRDLENGDENLWTMNADGSGQALLTGDATHQESEAFYSPDGTKILFQVESFDRSISELWVMDANGTNKVQLTNTGGGFFNENPTWSPDGSKIAFTSDRSDVGDEIWVMNADGSDQHSLTPGDTNSEHPTWSPDGTKIVFASDRDDSDGLWVMNADGTTPVKISGQLSCGQPDWARIVRVQVTTTTTTAPTTTTTLPAAAEAVVATPRFTG